MDRNEWLYKMVALLDTIQMTYDETGFWLEAEKLLETAPDDIKTLHKNYIKRLG